MHRLKFDDGVEPENVLLAYYNSVSFAFTEICGRSYGGGVLEILPGKMGNILIPKIQQIDPAFRSELLQEIDHVVRNDDDIEKVLNLVDREIFTKLLGINQDICSQCRIIWKNENEKIRAGINSAAEVYLQEVDESIGFFTEYLFLELSDTNLLITYCLKIGFSFSCFYTAWPTRMHYKADLHHLLDQCVRVMLQFVLQLIPIQRNNLVEVDFRTVRKLTEMEVFCGALQPNQNRGAKPGIFCEGLLIVHGMAPAQPGIRCDGQSGQHLQQTNWPIPSFVCHRFLI